MNWHAWIAGAVFLGTPLAVNAAELMTSKEISLRVRMGESPQTILEDTTRRKLMEPLTGNQEEVLRKAGLSAEWIAAFRSSALLASPEMVDAFQARKEHLRQQIAQTEQEAVQLPTQPIPTPIALSETKVHQSDIVKVGDRAPDFKTRAVGGKEVSLVARQGKVTLVTIFATWCQACISELTAIERGAWPKYQSAGLAVIALGSGHNLQELTAFKQKMNLTFDLAEDPKKRINALYATGYIPRCYLVGKDGLVKFASVGTNKEEFERMCAAIETELQQ